MTPDDFYRPTIVVTPDFTEDGETMRLLKKLCIITTKRYEAEGVIAGANDIYMEDDMKAMPKLKVISRLGVGLDNVDTKAAEALGIRVYITPDETTDAVAEHTLALTLALMKRIGFPAMKKGRMLRGKTVGIIGLGRIGTAVARLFEAFGCHIMFYDPNYPIYHTIYVSRPEWHRAEDITHLVSSSDIITLHAPGQKTPILGETELSRVKYGAILINTARSSLVDEKALRDCLDNGRISAAGLDVANDPSLFYTCGDRVIITPHTATYTYESRDKMERRAATNLLAGLKL